MMTQNFPNITKPKIALKHPKTENEMVLNVYSSQNRELRSTCSLFEFLSQSIFINYHQSSIAPSSNIKA